MGGRLQLEERPPGRFDGLSSQYAHGIIILHLGTRQRVEEGVLDMPEISRFFGIIIAMFYDEHNPPHFHARYGHTQAAIEIATFRV